MTRRAEENMFQAPVSITMANEQRPVVFATGSKKMMVFEADGTLVREGDTWHLVAYILSFQQQKGEGGSRYQDVWLQLP